MPDAPMLGASDRAGAAKKVKLDEDAFGARFLGPLVHQSVRAEQAARRRGTAATKTRAMVSGGGAKPWRQKGSGRARAGSNRSPIWTGGGTAFGPQPRSYTFKVNRKEQRAALRSALSLHAERGSIAILDAASFQAPKTRQAFDLLDGWSEARPTLGVTDLLGAASLVVSEPALDALSSRASDRSKIDRQAGQKAGGRAGQKAGGRAGQKAGGRAGQPTGKEAGD
jgi:large subunit ribosomal protein L4